MCSGRFAITRWLSARDSAGSMQQSISAPGCSGINHADFSIDGRYAIFTCEFRGGGLVKIDLINRQVLGYLRFSKKGMPQDIRISPDGSRFYVADMHADGVYVVDVSSFKQIDFIPTGVGTELLRNVGDGRGQAASDCWLTVSMPSMNFTPVI